MRDTEGTDIALGSRSIPYKKCFSNFKSPNAIVILVRTCTHVFRTEAFWAILKIGRLVGEIFIQRLYFQAVIWTG